MERLTERELMMCGNVDYKKCSSDNCFGYCGACDIDKEVGMKLKHYEDLEEQGLLAPVVHGEWLCIEKTTTYYETLIHERCSVCDRKVTRTSTQPQVNFCPNCGADMREPYKGE